MAKAAKAPKRKAAKAPKRKAAKAEAKSYTFHDWVVIKVTIPQGETRDWHWENRDYVIIPLTTGRVRWSVRDGKKITSGTRKQTTGIPIFFDVGDKGREVRIKALDGVIAFGKIYLFRPVPVP